MRITLLRSPGNEVLKNLDLSDRRAEMLEGEIVDVPDKAGKALIEQKIAVAGGDERRTVRAVPGAPALRGTPGTAGRSTEAAADRNVDQFNDIDTPDVQKVEPGKPKKA